MKNFQNYKAEKYSDSKTFVEVEDGIYRTKDPYGIHDKDIYVTSLSFEHEPECLFEEEASPRYIPQLPFECLLDEFNVFVTDFYDKENKASEVICYQEFGAFEADEIRKLRTIIGKRFYAVANPEFSEDSEDEDEFFIRIE